MKNKEIGSKFDASDFTRHDYNKKKGVDTAVGLEEKEDLKKHRDADLYYAKEKSEEKADLAPAWIYDNINEITKNCRKIYFIYLTFLSYTLFTILTTPIQDIFLGENVKLPLADSAISINYFVFLVPLIAIGLFIYKQLYLIKINELIKFAIEECQKTKPACKKNTTEKKCDIHNICQDQQNRLYPWIIIFSRFSEDKKSEEKIVGKIQRFFVKYSLWGFLPTVLVGFSIFVIKKHDIFLSGFLLSITIIGSIIVFIFWLINQHSGKISEVLSTKKGTAALLSLTLTVSSFLYIYINIKAREGVFLSQENIWRDEDIDFTTKILRSIAFADLSQKRLTKEPDGSLKDTVPFWLNFEAIHLEGGNLSYANLSKANLQNSNFKYANLNSARLVDANLDSANLNFAELAAVNLNGASLYKAQLQNANLISAKMHAASLNNAQLQGANLYRAELRRATLTRANLLYANLVMAQDITAEQLTEANNYQLAFYSYDIVEALNLPADHNTKIKERDFRDYVLTESNLSGADLRGAKLDGTILTDVNLQAADLRQTTGLKKKQLFKAINFQFALYSKDWLNKLHLPLDHNKRVKAKKFDGYDLQRCNFHLADLKKASLKEVNLKSANLAEANFEGANLYKADLQKSVLLYANLSQANLRNANFRDANLKFADLQGATLNGSILIEADLQGTDLRRAKGITIDQLLTAKNYKLALYSSKWLNILNLPPDHNIRVKEKNLSGYNLQGADLRGAELWGANLSEADLSGAKLSNANLDEANLNKTNLVKADLRKSQLRKANLQKADLREANLNEADLWKANLSEAKLQKATLSKADCNQAILVRADLRNAVLNETNLQNADLRLAELKGARLTETKLARANLEYTDFQQTKEMTIDQMFSARNFQLAFYSKDWLEKLKLPPDHNERLRVKNLQGYDLQGANLRGANLREANLSQAKIRGANLQYANLRHVKGITKKQLFSAKNYKLAFYSVDWLVNLKLPLDHNDRVLAKNLQGYDLKGANLEEADLWGFNLRKTDLKRSNLSKANLFNADLQLADLRGAKGIEKEQLIVSRNFQLAIYGKEWLEKLELPPDHNKRVESKNLRDYDLHGINFQKADLQNANLVEANLQGASLKKADLQQANIEGANLQGANLQEASLRRATLEGADLKKADLNYADLREANLKNVDLFEADLRNADIRGADLAGSNLHSTDLRDIVYFGHEQFAKVDTLYQAKMDKSLMDLLYEKYRFLFKKPTKSTLRP